MSDTDTAARLWAVLKHESPVARNGGSAQVRVARLAEACAVTAGTARKYLRAWALGGYVAHPNDDRAVVRLTARHAAAPALVWDCAGKLAYLSHPDEPETVTIDFQARPPAVTRRPRMAVAPAPVETPDAGPPVEGPPGADAVPSQALVPEDNDPPALLLAGGLGPPVASLSAVQAVQRIVALHGIARAVCATIHGEVLEAAWVIRRAYPERAAFERFVTGCGLAEVMPPSRAWLAAETWEVARRQRALRELVADRPNEAIRFVAEFVAEAPRDKLETDDPRVAEILALPGRKRTPEIRRLVALERSVGEGRHPADVEQIRTLSAERDAALEEIERRRTVIDVTDTPVGHVRMLHREAQELADRLTDIGARFEAFMARHPPAECSGALELAAHGMARLGGDIAELGERIGAAAFGETGLEAAD